MAASVIGLSVAFGILFIVFSALEWVRRRRTGRALFRAGYLTDLTYWFATPLIHRGVQIALLFVVVVPLSLLIWGKVDKNLIEHGFGPLSRLPFWLQALLILVIGDFTGYWMHRAFHGRWLWRFHAVHHSSTELDWLSSVRVHPVNEIIMRIASALVVLPLGFAPLAFAAIAPVLTLYAIFIHADVTFDWGPLRWLIASPRFHRWHHTDETAARDKNFSGFFPIWDLLFGTYHMPRGEVPTSFGTATPVGRGLWGQLIGPFRRQNNIARVTPEPASPRFATTPPPIDNLR